MIDDGDEATLANISAVGWKDVAFRVKDQVAKDRVGLLAAGVAFYGILALFPAITAIIAISGILIEPSRIVAQLNSFSALMPEEVITIITKQATAVAGARQGGLGFTAILGLLIALYSASKGTASLMQGLNVAYDEEDSRGFFKRMLVTFALTLMLIAGLICGLTATLAVPVVLGFVDMGPVVAILINATLWIGLIALTIVGLSVLYRFAPSRETPEWKWTSVGAVVGCLVWIVASASFAFFVSKFSYYNQSFGALAGVVVLLMWFWISAYIILMGAELNAELEAQARAVGADDETGPRGTAKADKPSAVADT
ncbi:YihY/virulence factor BrkB family protein [Sulfitobacter guttiformis]|uniref:Membrane protein n=1 Tax=Sulfitobacter guttiformis TaxID=74349 RepID=A0A420DUJ6_9RHOB|nr:YihY/virulence factor BrkB family protein [Sulfitobacter guttiformis]KIN71482.1 putative Ribonuclease BN [Sulfitobacter guttiformis KCTC 32187]RKE97915.1 membrane protein [Sulfitobacter guttiformis]